MNETQKKILVIAQKRDVNKIGIRELARQLDVHPQTAKYHREQLIKKGLMRRTGTFKASRVSDGLLMDVHVITIPYLGAANCGPAMRLAGSEPAGELSLSSRFLKTTQYDSLFAVKADGSSMNRASLFGDSIENGDFVIVDSKREPQKNEYVVATVGGVANIKKYVPEYDQDNQLERITLLSESDGAYDPILVHPQDAADGGLIAGVAIQVVKSSPAFS